MKRLTLRCCSRLPALSTVNGAVHHRRPGFVVRKLVGSSAVPEPVVVCRRRSQLLLSYAVRLSMHATSTERVILFFSLLRGDYWSPILCVVNTCRCLSTRLLVARLDFQVHDVAKTGCLECCCKSAPSNDGHIRGPKVLCESLLVGSETVSIRHGRAM